MSVAEDRTTLDELCVNTIRTLSMDAVQKANSGHPGTPMALAPLAYVLYTRVMEHAPSRPDWPDRDRFVLSCGHASMLLYSTLYLTGYGLELDDLKQFRQLGSPTAGHPEYGHAAGIETTTGPLGQGISTAVGMALAERMLAERFNREGHAIVDHYTYVIASDGDLQEGVASEASSLAGHLGLGRLIAFWDDNHISIEGDTALSFTEDVATRYEAYGWHVQNLGEDIGLERIEEALANARDVTDRPSLIVVRTHIAPGSPNKQDTHEAHGAPLGDEEIRLTKEAYNWPSQEPFFVPDEALEHFRSTVARGEELESAWRERFERYRADFPDEAAQFERMLARELPEGWDADVPKKGPDAGMIATRKASQDVIQWAAAQVPELIGGSADLAPSTLTLIKGADSIANGAYGGRNLHFGIREHGMGAIVNGLVLSGFRAFGAGFFIFSDYMKASLRLAAIMRIPSTFVFTARLDRRRRGRPDAPADRAARGAAGDAEHQRRAAGGLQRDRAGVAVRADGHRDADGARAVPPGRPGVGPGRRAARRDRARRLRPARQRGRRPGADPDGDRDRGPHRPRRVQAARRRGHQGAAREHALPGSVRGPGPGVPRQRPTAGRQGPRRRRGGRRAGLAPLGGRRRRGGRDARLRRLRPRQSALRALWLHGGEGRRSGASGA